MLWWFFLNNIFVKIFIVVDRFVIYEFNGVWILYKNIWIKNVVKLFNGNIFLNGENVLMKFIV